MATRFTQEQAETIELILLEADAFGLRWEVKQFAEDYLDQHMTEDPIEAYQWAYDDWCK